MANRGFAFGLLFLLVSVVQCFQPTPLQAAEVAHPIMNPPAYTQGNCPDCGMMLNMWARTRHVFTLSTGRHETCSIRCLADLATKAGEEPADVQVALYFAPETMVTAQQASYVIGSSAKGTMSGASKIAFAEKPAALAFASANGGEVHDFAGAYGRAVAELEKSRPMIDANRHKMGKIKEPTDTDRCGRCGMYPARYPAHRSQILIADGATMHFCSTRCLINHQPLVENIASVWVTVYPEGGYDYANGLYYVVDSRLMGPMGPEALPFRRQAAAREFIAKEGGRLMLYKDLSPAVFAAPARGGMVHHH